MDHKFFFIFIANRIFMRFSIYYMYCLNISCCGLLFSCNILGGPLNTKINQNL